MVWVIFFSRNRGFYLNRNNFFGPKRISGIMNKSSFCAKFTNNLKVANSDQYVGDGLCFFNDFWESSMMNEAMLIVSRDFHWFGFAWLWHKINFLIILFWERYCNEEKPFLKDLHFLILFVAFWKDISS